MYALQKCIFATHQMHFCKATQRKKKTTQKNENSKEKEILAKSGSLI